MQCNTQFDVIYLGSRGYYPLFFKILEQMKNLKARFSLIFVALMMLQPPWLFHARSHAQLLSDFVPVLKKQWPQFNFSMIFTLKLFYNMFNTRVEKSDF